MDSIGRKLLIVLDDDGKFFSVLSIGDIQRAIIQNIPLDRQILEILRKEIKVARMHESLDDIKKHMRLRRNEFMPVVDEHNFIQKLIFFEDLFIEKQPVDQFDLPIVIMAGGKGKRLKPLTNIIPKPLIPINDKTIIEDIMDRFLEHGSNNFYISVNYKADMIRYYFQSLNNLDYFITFLQEDNPLGTAGSLGLLKGQISTTFFVTNCDILIDEDYSEILRYHRENNNEITLIAVIKHFPIPYGTLETSENGILTGLKEKPELTFKINSGMYIIEPHILNEIPVNEFFHITQLIENIMKRQGKVGVFPVSENSWKDMGSLSEYKFFG
jgi:dTDP-glucose pyrophosphorylase